MFTELALSIHEKENPKTLTNRILGKVASVMTNTHEDARGKSVNMLGTRLGSIPVITEGRLTNNPHITRYVYFLEFPDITNPLQIKGVAIDGRSITEYEFRQGQPDTYVAKKTTLTAAWEIFTQIDKRIPIQFPEV